MVRIAAGIAAVVAIVLLGWVVVESFDGPRVVMPTNGVTEGPQDGIPAGDEAREALALRTALQDYRGDTGPSPDAETGEIANGTLLAPEPDPRLPGVLVQDWLDARDADAPVLRPAEHLEGLASLPATQYGVLEQPEGRDFRRTHEGFITNGGGWVIFGAGALLALFLLFRGRIPIGRPPEGTTIERFDGVERTNHWMTATSFVMLALSGLVLLYNRTLLLPWLGAETGSAITEGALWVHLAFIAPFLIGIAVMAVLWFVQNLPDRYDGPWLRRFGGFLGGGHPPAARFNTGQKLVFWGVLGFGLIEAASGFTLIYPFFWTDVNALQWILIVHAGVGLLFMAMIMGHIYIGTVGMVGAIDAMWSGRVDTAWAKEHHSVWYERETGRSPDEDPVAAGRGPAPAE